MNKDQILAVGKSAAKNVGTIVALTLGIMIAVHFATALYDLRIALGVLAGRFGYDLAYSLFNRIKALQ